MHVYSHLADSCCAYCLSLRKDQKSSWRVVLWDFLGKIGTDFFSEVFWQEFKNLGMLFLYSKVLEMSWGQSKVMSIGSWNFWTHSTPFCHSVECYTAPSEWPTRGCQLQDSVSQYQSISIINNRIEGQFPSMSHPRYKTKNFTSHKKISRLRKNANCILSIAHASLLLINVTWYISNAYK